MRIQPAMNIEFWTSVFIHAVCDQCEFSLQWILSFELQCLFMLSATNANSACNEYWVLNFSVYSRCLRPCQRIGALRNYYTFLITASVTILLSHSGLMVTHKRLNKIWNKNDCGRANTRSKQTEKKVKTKQNKKQKTKNKHAHTKTLLLRHNTTCKSSG